MNNKYPILDVCCGPKSMWFDKDNPLTLYVDKRMEVIKSNLPGRSPWAILPNIVCDFTRLPFHNDLFHLVCFDPPHLSTLGKNAHMAKRYGRLFPNWDIEIKAGFDECWRVLISMGILIFKWNETEIPLKRIIGLAPSYPLFGHTTNQKRNTHWITFIKANKRLSIDGAKGRATS